VVYAAIYSARNTYASSTDRREYLLTIYICSHFVDAHLSQDLSSQIGKDATKFVIPTVCKHRSMPNVHMLAAISTRPKRVRYNAAGVWLWLLCKAALSSMVDSSSLQDNHLIVSLTSAHHHSTRPINPASHVQHTLSWPTDSLQSYW
jgi:hypothetical protein